MKNRDGLGRGRSSSEAKENLSSKKDILYVVYANDEFKFEYNTFIRVVKN